MRWLRGFSDTEQIYRSEGTDVLALSAFYLSSLSTSLARRDLVKQIWSSGASVIVSASFSYGAFHLIALIRFSLTMIRLLDLRVSQTPEIIFFAWVEKNLTTLLLNMMV